MKQDGVINFADPHQKRKFLAMLGALSEPHQVEMKPYKPRRSGRANRYWFSVVVKALCAYFEEQGETRSPEWAHAFIVRNVLPEVEVVNKLTGVVYRDRQETHGMTTEQFSDLIERGHAWLADWGIVVETYREFQQTENACRV